MDIETIANKENLTTAVVGVAVGAPSLFLFIKKFFLQSKIVDTQIAAAEASTDVIGMLRNEIDRLDKQNQEILKRLGDVHSENVELRKENTELRQEISHLNVTIAEMQEEIAGIGRRRDDRRNED